MATLELEEDTGGYNYQFDEEPPDSLKCLICLSVVKEPQQHAGCGKLFCKVCIDQYKLGSRNDCPYCRKSLRDYYGASTLFPDLRSEQEVKSLLVCCTPGCGWMGELRDIEDHKEKDCPDAQIPCPRRCNNGTTKIARRNIKIHMQKCPNRPYFCKKCKQEMEFRKKRNHETSNCPKRRYACPNCNEAGVYDELTTTHLEICPNVEIVCFKCLTRLLRCNAPKHELSCPNQPVHCKYYNIGCQFEPLRKYLPEHEQDYQYHLGLAMKKILTLSLKHTLTFKITNFTQKKAEETELFSPDYSTSEQGYKVCLSIDANGNGEGAGTHVSVYAHLMKGDHDDTLTWPFTGSVTVELLNQLEDKNHYKHTITFLAESENSKRVVDGERGGGYGCPEFISHTALDYNASTNTQYLKDDTLVFRVSAEAPDHKPWLECAHTV